VDRLLNAIKGHSGAQDAAGGQPRFGNVTSVDPLLGTVRVQLQPEGVLTGWLPLLSGWVGNGWGLSCPPSPGDQVLVLPQEGDAENGVVIGRAWSDSAAVPNTPTGELWLTHQSGSYLRLLNNGTVSINGDLHVNGDVYDRHGSLSQLRGHYNEHTHSDPQGGNSSTPNPQD
jgi:phage baseplate assembly protein gpV